MLNFPTAVDSGWVESTSEADAWTAPWDFAPGAYRPRVVAVGKRSVDTVPTAAAFVADPAAPYRNQSRGRAVDKRRAK